MARPMASNGFLLALLLSAALAADAVVDNGTCSSPHDGCAGVREVRETRWRQPLTTLQQPKCVPQSPPVRLWKPVPLGPGEVTPTFNLNLKLEVFVRAPTPTEEEDFEALSRSLQVQGLKVNVLPNGAKYGTEQFKQVVDAYKTENNTVILMLNSAAALANGVGTEILRKFESTGVPILFAAERRCRQFCHQKWPAPEEPWQAQYMDADAFIGYAPAVAEMFEHVLPSTSKSHVTEQQVLMVLYIHEETRNSLGIALDANSTIFQSLYGWKDDLIFGEFEIDISNNESRVARADTGIYPAIVLSGGNGKLLGQIGNYVPLVWTTNDGCIMCRERISCLNESHPASLPLVHVAAFIDEASPFLPLFLKSIVDYSYPHARLSVQVLLQATTSTFAKYNATVHEWAAEHKDSFHKLEITVDNSLFEMRRHALSSSSLAHADYVFMLSSHFRINLNNTLQHLIAQNRTAIAPMMTRHKKLWSNFWGAVDGDFDAQCFDIHTTCRAWAITGECQKNEEWMTANCELSCGKCSAPGQAFLATYRRSWEYTNIVEYDISGVFAVPMIMDGLLLQRGVATTLEGILNATLTSSDVASKLVREEENPFFMAAQLSQFLRKAGVHLHVTNQLEFGSIIDPSGFDSSKARPDLFLLENNLNHWSDMYLHENYSSFREIGFVLPHCWDIYNFPLVNELFCKHFIELSEDYGRWSGASKEGGKPAYDERLNGGYEPVPTQDIHFNQKGMDFQETWKLILMNFIAPVAESKFVGYTVDGRNTLDFVVKYQPEGQPFLRPHHDASTFSVNIALNQIGVDFTGGGTHFIRQNCTILTNKVGHALIHPGRLTHHHEGLYVTGGTRYIIVSFVDQ